MKKLLLTIIISAMLFVTMADRIYADDNESQDSYEKNGEIVENDEIEYLYEYNKYGINEVIGFYYNKESYSYIRKNNIITGIMNSEGEQIVKYEYDENNVISAVFSKENEIWIENDDKDFIGNINCILWEGIPYDRETGHYIIYSREYDPVADEFTDGINNQIYFRDRNPFVECRNDNGIALLGYETNELLAEQWKDELLEDKTYGAAVAYSSNWYGSIATVELLARMIYAENHASYEEQKGVAWVVLNRLFSSSFPGTVRDIVIEPYQFSSIAPNSGDAEHDAEVTKNARIVDTSSQEWKNATFLACLMLTTTDTSEWIIIVGKPIGTQLFFCSYTNAKNGSKFRNSGNSLQYYSDGTWINVTDVQVIGYGTYSNAAALFNLSGITDYTKNIFYNR